MRPLVKFIRVGRCILAASTASQSVVKALVVLHVVRHSLLVPLLGVYLVFVAAVLGAYLEVYSVAQQQVTTEVQSTDLALAQETALETGTTLHGARACAARPLHRGR